MISLLLNILRFSVKYYHAYLYKRWIFYAQTVVLNAFCNTTWGPVITNVEL